MLWLTAAVASETSSGVRAVPLPSRGRRRTLIFLSPQSAIISLQGKERRRRKHQEFHGGTFGKHQTLYRHPAGVPQDAPLFPSMPQVCSAAGCSQRPFPAARPSCCHGRPAAVQHLPSDNDGAATWCPFSCWRCCHHICTAAQRASKSNFASLLLQGRHGNPRIKINQRIK